MAIADSRYESLMSPLACVTSLAGLTAGLGFALFVAVPAATQPAPAVVITDTDSYCRELSAKLSELIRIAPRPPETEVLNMGVEGRRLCAEGEVRGGILRLRRGVTVMLADLDARGEP